MLAITYISYVLRANIYYLTLSLMTTF